MKVIKEDFLEKKDNIPAIQGYFVLRDSEGKALYSMVCTNLQNRIRTLLHSAIEDETVLQLSSLSQTIEFVPTDTLFEALLLQKEIIALQNPAFNQSLTFNKHYTYLAFDFHNAPFLSVSEDTQKKLFYLGPFQLRFFVLDVVQVFADLFRFPLCEGKVFPCKRLTNELCDGFCLKHSSEWQSVLLTSYFQKNEELLDLLRQKETVLNHNLDFLAADKVKKQRELLEKYYLYITFFHVVKQLNLSFNCSGKQVTLTNGQISEMEISGSKYYFPFSQLDYRENEILAIEKSQLDDAWIVFQYLYQTDKKRIEKLYSDSVKKMEKMNMEKSCRKS